MAVSHNRMPVFIVMTLLTAFLSALYMARAMFVPFFGALRREQQHVHDAPSTMAVPMCLLAVLAAGFGFLAINWPGEFIGFGGFVFDHKPHGFEFEIWLGVLSMFLAVAAFLLAYLFYFRRAFSLDGIRNSLSGLVRVVENKYYFDEVYQWTIDRVVLVFSNFVGLFDRIVVNDVAVNGPANAVRRLGIAMRVHVTGHVYSYAMGMVVGTVAVALFWWLISA